MTTGHDQLGLGALPMGLTYQPAGLTDGVGGDRAGVDHQDVRIRGPVREAVPMAAEAVGPQFQFRLVETAAQGLEMNLHGGE